MLSHINLMLCRYIKHKGGDRIDGYVEGEDGRVLIGWQRWTLALAS